MRLRIHRQWEDAKVEALARLRKFGWMEYRELELIGPYLTETTAAAGVTVITEGEPNHNFFLLTSGVLEATQGGGHKRFLRAGESFGATPLSATESATETIRAVTDARLLVAGNEQNQAQSQRMARHAEGRPAGSASMAMVPNLAQ